MSAGAVPPQPVGARPSARALLGVALLAVLPFLPGLNNPFLDWDDDLYVTRNARVMAGTFSSWLSLLSPSDALQGRFIEYFPLRDSIYALLWVLWRDNPVPYHVVQVLLHAGVCAVLVLLAWRLGVGTRAAILAGVAFAVMAVHAESVIWISTLKDPLYSLFFLGSLTLYLKARQEGRGKDMLLALGCLVLSLLSKSLGFVLPGILVVVELGVLGERRLAKVATRVAPFAVVGGAFLALILVVGKANALVGTGAKGQPLWQAIIGAGDIMPHYLWNMLVPVELNARYIVLPASSPLDPKALWLVVLLALCAGLAWLAGRGRPLPLVLLGWWLVTLLPVANLVPIPGHFADRYAYMPSVAVAVGLGMAVAAAWERQAVRAGFLVWLLFSASLTVLRVLTWGDPVVLWREVVEQPYGDRFGPGWLHLGNALDAQGRQEEALEAWLKAEEAQTRNPSRESYQPFLRTAVALLDLGQPQLALPHARQAAGRTGAMEAASHITLATTLRALGDGPAALEALEQALLLRPLDPDLTWELLKTLHATGQTAAALARHDQWAAQSPSLCAAWAPHRAALPELDAALKAGSRACESHP